MIEPEDVLQIAIGLLDDHRLTARQWDCWYAFRYLGMDSRAAAAYLQREHQYQISHTTVIADSRYAHEIVVAACEETEQGRVRLGVTVASGTEAWFAPDSTLQAVAHKVRVVAPKRGPPSLAYN